MTTPETYWNLNIIKWEQARYRKSSFFGKSIQSRLTLIADLLRKHGSGLRVLELGCGSGLLYSQLTEVAFKSYTAVDVSETAIEKFRKSLSSEQLASTKLIQSSLADLDINEIGEFDIVVSAGLIDWLNNEDSKKLSHLTKGKLYIHSFSLSQKFSFNQCFHKIYQRFSPRKKFAAYSRYHTIEEIKALFDQAEIVRFKNGRFGRLAIHLPMSKTPVVQHFQNQSRLYFQSQKKFPWNLLKKIEKRLLPSPSLLVPGGSYLSIGAGNFDFLSHLKRQLNADITILDISNNMLATSPEGFQRILADYETHDFQNRKFDVIFFIGCLEFFEDAIKAIEKADKILSTKGVVFIITAENSWLSEFYKKYHLKNGIKLNLIKQEVICDYLKSKGYTLKSKSTVPGWNYSLLYQKS